MSTLYKSYTMPDGSTATICAYKSPKGVFGAKLELANGKTLPISIGGAPGKPVRSFTAAMRGAEKFLRGVYGTARTHHVGKKQTARRIAYRLQLTPSELSAVEMARGRYAWPDMLSAHASENGAIAFTESDMWQWNDDVDSDAEGGHSPFPMASGSLAAKLEAFRDKIV